MLKLTLFGVFFVLCLAACSAHKQGSTVQSAPETPEKQSNLPFYPTIDGKWIGLGISYGSYRDGESPKKGSVSSKADILEDLKILTEKGSKSWHLIRMYGADPASEQVLEVIKENNLPVRVMQGAWLDSHQTAEENEEQVNELIRLANKFPEIIVAVNAGNEIFVDWSWHKFEQKDYGKYLGWVRRIKESVNVPVTLADDYNFWNKPWSQPIAAELDFIVLHAYAMWNSQTLDNAVSWTAGIYNDIQSRYPDKQIVLGESGWATSSISTNGDERLIIGEASERAQAIFLEEYEAWLAEHQVSSFLFEAFDEKWKGGEDKPDGIAEKNWGLFHSDRTPKESVKKYFEK